MPPLVAVAVGPQCWITEQVTLTGAFGVPRKHAIHRRLAAAADISVRLCKVALGSVHSQRI